MIMDAQMNVKATVKTTTPCFTFDHIHKQIVGTELNFKKSGIPGSAQDVELMARLAEHPNYTFQIIKPAKEKNSYKGLTCPLMAEYLEMTKQELLSATLKKMRDDGVGFPTIKSWFLDLFPHFNVSKAKREICDYRLGNVKQKYKVVKANPKTTDTSKPAINIAELPKVIGQ